MGVISRDADMASETKGQRACKFVLASPKEEKLLD